MLEVDLPYFDQIIEHVGREPDSSLAVAFRRHVHWGCFEHPELADDSLEAYVAAAEAMTRRVVDAAGVADGQQILDVGCGFGGTVDHLNERLRWCRLVGLNIDGRQLAVARALVTANPTNTVAFVAADACRLPVVAAAFDTVSAVESAFHFPSRRRFFREVARVLRPGGALTMSDFICGPEALTALAQHQQSADGPKADFYGHNTAPLTSAGYRRLAEGAGLELRSDLDITVETLPTYAAMRRLYREAGLVAGERATDELEVVARRGLLEYHILVFAKPAKTSDAADPAATSHRR